MVPHSAEADEAVGGNILIDYEAPHRIPKFLHTDGGMMSARFRGHPTLQRLRDRGNLCRTTS